MCVEKELTTNRKTKKPQEMKVFKYFIFLIIPGCCSNGGIEFKVPITGRMIINCFNSEDTIIFQNNLSKYDTILVLGVDSIEGESCIGLLAPRPIGESIWLSIRYFPSNDWRELILDAATGDTIIISNDKLISVTRDPVLKNNIYNFNFKNFQSTTSSLEELFNEDTLFVNDIFIDNYFKIPHSHPERTLEPTDILTLIWTRNGGLTAFQCVNGDWWTKKNWDNEYERN